MATQALSQQPVEVFISFSPADQKLLVKLEKSLAVLVQQRIISIWHSNNIEAGKEGAREVSHFINTASIILLLISSDFLASDFCYSEDFVHALERHADGEALLIPIILRPCDWENAPFGNLPALPDGAQPVTTWSIQDEAFRSIAKSIRLLILEGVEVGTPKPTNHFKREIPPLLPYLCNRIEQEEELSGIFSAGNAGPHRPFVCIVHGNEDECHDMYKSRLQHNSLPKLLHGSLPGKFSISDIYLPFPRSMHTAEQGFSVLRNNLAERVTYNRQASDDEIAEILSQYRTPVIIHSYLRAESWEPHGPDLVDAFIRYWNVFPSLPPATCMIICLFVIYTETSEAHAQAGPATAERQGDNSLRARNYLNSLDFTSYGGVRGVVLPEMSAIPLMDAEDYFRDDRCFSEICKLHSPSFCNIQGAIEEIRSYYKGVENKYPAAGVPMQHLAKELRRVLEKNLC